MWAVAKGSLINKADPRAGGARDQRARAVGRHAAPDDRGAFLCYEGVEKLAHKLPAPRGEDNAHHAELRNAVADPDVDIVALEKEKIKGAIRTDFILSAEIIVITLGTVAAAPFGKRVAVLAASRSIMTVGVYGLVAGIVKLDDAGLYLSRRGGDGACPARGIGRRHPAGRA